MAPPLRLVVFGKTLTQSSKRLAVTRFLVTPVLGSGWRMTPNLVSLVWLATWLVMLMISIELATTLQLRGGQPKPKLISCIVGAPSKKGEYRYVGSDIQEKVDAQGKYIEINQDFYIETIGDLAIDSFRFGQPELPMQPAEVAKCRASLGALQWVAVQTQPLICARCNLLLSDLARAPKMKVAQEIQYVINEVRKNPSRLTFRRLNSVQHWSQMVFVCMGDQSHNNRH